MRLLHSPVAWLTTLLALAVAGACSSDGDDNGNGGGNGNGGSSAGTGQGGFNTGTGANGSGANGNLTDGGLDELRDASCAGWHAEPENQPVVLQFVVDNSGSMDHTAPNTGGQTKWAITREALRDAIAGLPASTSVGVLYYPNRGTSASDEPRAVSACVNTDENVPVGLLGDMSSAQREQINDSLDDADPNSNGGTPTHDAYKLAFQELGESTAVGTRYMLLITDGQPTFLENCVGSGRTSEPVDEQPIIDEIAAARASASGIRTFIIGSPGSESNVSTGEDVRPWLSEAARAGGTEADGCDDSGPNFCHFDMSQAPDFAAALRGALAEIAGAIISCTYDLPVPPAGQTLDPANVNVVYTPSDSEPVLIPRDDSDACDYGWQYADGSQQQVVLCESACQTVQQDARAGLELLFGCRSQGMVE